MATRDRIIKAVETQLRTKGTSFSYRETERMAEVGSGSLRHHFRTKEAAIAEAIRPLILAQRLWEPSLRPAPNASADLREWLDALMEALLQNTGVADLMIEGLMDHRSPFFESAGVLSDITGRYLGPVRAARLARRDLAPSLLFGFAAGFASVAERLHPGDPAIQFQDRLATAVLQVRMFTKGFVAEKPVPMRRKLKYPEIIDPFD